MSKTARAKTADEIRDEILEYIHRLVDYWDRESQTPNTRDKLDGLAFSILTMFDGDGGMIPAFDIICSPHPDDEAYNKSRGENWYPAVQINEYPLHEMWYKPNAVVVASQAGEGEKK